jgi:hypothetical protein
MLLLFQNQENAVQVDFAWNDPNSTTLNDYVLRVSQDSLDPATGTWEDAAVSVTQSAGIDMSPNTGTFHFFVVGKFNSIFGANKETGPSNILTVDTAEPLPMEALRLEMP